MILMQVSTILLPNTLNQPICLTVAFLPLLLGSHLDLNQQVINLASGALVVSIEPLVEMISLLRETTAVVLVSAVALLCLIGLAGHLAASATSGLVFQLLVGVLGFCILGF